MKTNIFSFVTTLRAVLNKDGNPTRAKPYLIRSYKCTRPTDSSQPSRKNTPMPPSRGNSNLGLNGNGGNGLPPINVGNAHDYEIWEVARAATAARYFFDPIKIHDPERNETILFEDGGLGQTINPTDYGVSDIRMRHGNDYVGIVVSVGTARGDLAKHKDPFRFKRKVMQTVAITCDPQVTHNLMLQQSNGPHGFQYYRINPEDKTDDHLLNMPFDQWLPRRSFKGDKSGSGTLKTIKDAFNSWWSSDNAVAEYFEDCARNLVHQRRLRSQHRNKWERYAMATAFECRRQYCDRQDRTWTDAFEFEEHLKSKHGLHGEALVVEKRQAANPWQYREVTNNDRQGESTRKMRIDFR